MKKNRMMRLASGLLVAVLATTSVISGTYAKYVTSDGAEDSARVAKWGVTVVASGNLYGDKYAQGGTKITAKTSDDEVSVYGLQSTAPNKVVAPGTSSDEGFHFAVNGKPEVDALVSMDIAHKNVFLAEGNYGVMVEVPDVTEENFVSNTYYVSDGTQYTLVASWPATEPAKWYELHDAATVGTGGYWPVVYTMEGATTSTGDTTSDSLKALADKVIAKVGTPGSPAMEGISGYTYTDIEKHIEQNKDIATAMGLNNIGISWKWAFDGVNDSADTILGNLMAKRIDSPDWVGEVVKTNTTGYTNELVEGTDYCLDTNFSIEITVTQVD